MSHAEDGQISPTPLSDLIRGFGEPDIHDDECRDEPDLDRLVMDAIFFADKVRPPKGHSTAATVLACTRPDRLRSLPFLKHKASPGRHEELRLLAEQMANESGMQAGPLCRLGQTKDGIINSVTQHVVTKRLLGGIGSGEAFSSAPDVNVSTVTHENEQLCWRDGIPRCSSGLFCAVLTIPRAQEPGPLPIYLYPEEEMAFRRTGQAPKRTAGMFCLLCIRRAAHCTTLAERATESVGGGARQAKLLPPFTNLCNVVDGYRREAMGVTPSNTTFRGAVHICGISGDMEVKFDRLRGDRGTWYVNQGVSMVFTGATESR